jgi:hypothetical protein
MTSPIPYGPYSGPQRWVKTAPAWAPPKDRARVFSYQIYTEIYWSHVDQAYKVMNRGLDQDDLPLYVPSSRIVVDTLNRYVGKDLRFVANRETGTPESRLNAQKAVDDLLKRERFYSRYEANKRQGLVKGDWCWHLVADPNKPQGRRISILTAQPDAYFTTYEDELKPGGDPDKLMQVRLVELVQAGDEQQARVQLYDKWNEGNPSDTIYSSLRTYKQEEWFLLGEDAKPHIEELLPPTPLPAAITSFPVYHVPMDPDLDNPPWGISAMRGFEGLQAALNQSITDEDLALALTGIGVYATDEPGSPVTKAGEPTDWFIYPGAVISAAKGLRRVEGITSFQPYTEHVGRLEGYMADASGATDAARGRLEVSEAESGIALQLKLGPTISKAEVMDHSIIDVHTQLIYDLVTMWLPTFEGMNFTDVEFVVQLGDKLPVNRKAEVELVTQLVVAKVVSAGSARTYLAKRGFGELFDLAAEGDLVLAEAAALAAAEGGDALADREAQETETVTEPGAGDA